MVLACLAFWGQEFKETRALLVTWTGILIDKCSLLLFSNMIATWELNWCYIAGIGFSMNQPLGRFSLQSPPLTPLVADIICERPLWQRLCLSYRRLCYQLHYHLQIVNLWYDIGEIFCGIFFPCILIENTETFRNQTEYMDRAHIAWHNTYLYLYLSYTRIIMK